MNPKISGIIFTVVYLTFVNPAHSINLVTRGYQILDPETGYVIPPAVNQGPPKATTNFKRDTKKDTFVEELEEVPVQYIEHEIPHSYRQQQNKPRRDFIGRDLHQFPSIFDQFEHPFLGPDPTLFTSSSTSKRHTSQQQHSHQDYDEYNESFEEPSDDHHFQTTGHHYGGGDVEEYTIHHHNRPSISESIHHVENNDLNFIRPPRNNRKKVFKKHVRPPFRVVEDNSFHPAPFGVGIRPKRPHHQRPHRQPHKYRKKHPYYGRKKRSPEPMPWVLLDPMTGRNIRYPKQLYSSSKSVKRQNEYFSFDQQRKKQKRGQGKISPCFGTYFKEDCNYLLDTATPQEVKQDRDTAIPEPIISNSINVVRQARNLIPAAKPINNLQPYPVVTRYNKYRYLLGREKGSEYLSRYSGLPIYKYTKKYPLGYGRKKRSPEPMAWAILDPNTGRPIDDGNQRANSYRTYESRRRPNRNRFGSFFKRGNTFNGKQHLFYDKDETINNEIRHERRTKKNNRFKSTRFNHGSEYIDNHSGKPVYKYFKKFPNYGYGRKRRSAEPQKWELIDPITGRNVAPANRRPVPPPRPNNRNKRPRQPQDALFGQFFQKQIRKERFQPGPQFAPQQEVVNNHHQSIAQRPSQGIEIHTGDKDQDHLTFNGRPVYKHHKRYPYFG